MLILDVREAILILFAAAQHGLCNQLESRRSGAYPLGASANFQPSRYKTLLVRTRHITCLSAHNLAHYAGGMTTMLDDFMPDWQGQGNVWEAYRCTCLPGSPA